MEGTSQASPFMAGTIALWLQAYPYLTYEQVIEILQKTSRKHAKMDGKTWDARYGYGLVDAYEGLKEALRIGRTRTGEHRTHSRKLAGALQQPRTRSHAHGLLARRPPRRATPPQRCATGPRGSDRPRRTTIRCLRAVDRHTRHSLGTSPHRDPLIPRVAVRQPILLPDALYIMCVGA